MPCPTTNTTNDKLASNEKFLATSNRWLDCSRAQKYSVTVCTLHAYTHSVSLFPQGNILISTNCALVKIEEFCCLCCYCFPTLGGRLTSWLFAKRRDPNINPSTGTDREEDLNLGPPD